MSAEDRLYSYGNIRTNLNSAVQTLPDSSLADLSYKAESTVYTFHSSHWWN